MIMKKLLIPFLLFSISASAQFNIEKLLSAPFPNELKASNDGKYITWVFNDKGVRNVWFADEAGKNARQLTHYTDDDGLEITSLMVTPNDNSVVFVRGNDANSKGENANPGRLQTSTGEAVYLVYANMDSVKKIGEGISPAISPDGKQIAYISSSQVWLAAGDSLNPVKLFQSRGNQTQLRWSPDGSKLAYVSRRSGHAIIGIYNFSTKEILYPDASTNTDTDPVWSPDGKYLAYMRRPYIGEEMPFTPKRSSPLPWSIRLMDVASLQSTEIWKADEGQGSNLTDELPAVGNRLWFTADNIIIFPWEKDGWIHLYALDIQNKKVTLLTPGDGEVEKVVLSPDKKTIIYCTNIGDISRRHIYTITSLGTPVMVTKGDGIEYSPAALSKGISVLESTPQHPLWPAIVKPNGSSTDIAVNEFPKDYPSYFTGDTKSNFVYCYGWNAGSCTIVSSQKHEARGKASCTCIFPWWFQETNAAGISLHVLLLQRLCAESIFCKQGLYCFECKLQERHRIWPEFS